MSRLAAARSFGTRRLTVLGVVALVGVLVLALGPGLLRSMSSSLAQLGLGSFAYGYDYKIELAHTAGLKSGSQVRIAGVRKGVVRSIDIDGTKVVAEVVLDSDFRLGRQTRATVKMASLLGQQYIAIEPEGKGRLDTGATIPLSRTQVPYSLNDLAVDSTENVGAIDTDQLNTLLDTLGDTFEQTPEAQRAALASVERLATSTNERSEEISQLLSYTAEVTRLLAEERGAIFSLMGDADRVLTTIRQRRTMLHRLLVDTRDLAAEIRTVIKENNKRLRPTLKRLDQILTTLNDNEKVLKTLIERQAVTGRYFNNVQATGPYVNVFVPYSLIPDHVICVLGLANEKCS